MINVLAPSRPRTLSIMIDPAELRALMLGPDGAVLTERLRVDTPRPSSPASVIDVLTRLVKSLGEPERVSVGVPGIVVEGVVTSAPPLGPEWQGFQLASTLADQLHRPVRVINDAGMAGFAVIEGTSLEMVLTIGDRIGSSLYHDGVYIPNLELGSHFFKDGKTYDDYIGGAALAKLGTKKWNRRVAEVAEQILPIWNLRRLYIAGFNAKLVQIELPPEVHVTPNTAGLLGGVALWKDA
jgi:polyphosphate glucokinase